LQAPGQDTPNPPHQETSNISAQPIGIIATLEFGIRLGKVTDAGRIFLRFWFDRNEENTVGPY
jgi:hypothetical protein